MIYASNNTQNVNIDVSHMLTIDNSNTARLTGYDPQEINGDGIVDAYDISIINNNNSTALVRVKKPQ